MSGASDYVANLLGRWVTGQQPMAPLPQVWMALFATVPHDDGSAGTELAGNGYGRAQVAGQLEASEDVPNGAVLSFEAVPAWIVPGMTVFNTDNPGGLTAGQVVLGVDAINNTVTLDQPINDPVVTGDVIAFSAFGDPSGSAPSLFGNVGPIVFPLTTVPGPGTAYGWGFFDAPTGGNLLISDVLAGGAQVIAGNVSATFAADQLILSIT
jgi:hypothetical protein